MEISLSQIADLRGAPAKCSAKLCMVASGRDSLYPQFNEGFSASPTYHSSSPALSPQPRFPHQGLLNNLGREKNKTKTNCAGPHEAFPGQTFSPVFCFSSSLKHLDNSTLCTFPELFLQMESLLPPHSHPQMEEVNYSKMGST